MRLVIKIVKRDVKGITGDLDVRDAPSKLPMVRRRTHVRTVVSKDRPSREVMGLALKRRGSPGRVGHEVLAHIPKKATRQIVRTYRQRQTESRNGVTPCGTLADQYSGEQATRPHVRAGRDCPRSERVG